MKGKNENLYDNKKKCYYNKSLKLTNQYYSRFCIDNNIMIAHAGLLAYRTGIVTPLEETTCIQRYLLLNNRLVD